MQNIYWKRIMAKLVLLIFAYLVRKYKRVLPIWEYHYFKYKQKKIIKLLLILKPGQDGYSPTLLVKAYRFHFRQFIKIDKDVLYTVVGFVL